jgi:4-hydroxy-tetrahydrodipicolinate synthase
MRGKVIVSDFYICTAIGTPLDEDDNLCVDGLRRHLEEQASAGIQGVLVGGTMGVMPLLTSRTYGQLVHQSVKHWAGKGETLIGVGDLSFTRTKERIELVNELPIDGVVALTPFFLPYSQADLIEYFQALADISAAPLYLYDLPQRTGIALELATVQRLSEHPNIKGVKCSGDFNQTRRLIDAVAGSGFRVIVAQAPLTDYLMRNGVREFVDGVYGIVPRLTQSISEAAARGDWEASSKRMRILNGLLAVLVKYGIFPTTTALLNHRGIPGNFAPRPHRPLSPEAREQVLAEPAIREALRAG